MREYRISKKWVASMYVATSIVIGLSVWQIAELFATGARNGMKYYWLLAPTSLGMIAYLVLSLWNATKGRFVIDSDRVFATGLLSNRELRLNEIAGYRITNRNILIESHNPERKTIKVSRYLADVNEVAQWLAEHYADLDKNQVDNEKSAILNNERYGSTKELRQEELVKAHRVTRILNWIGGLICVWTLLIPYPYQLAIVSSVVFPLVCLMVMKVYSGLIRIDGRRGSVYPSTIAAFFGTSAALCLRSILDFNIVDHSNVWAPATLIALTYTVVSTIGTKEFDYRKAKDCLIILIYTVVAFAYGYGTTITLNCTYDSSQPEIASTSIVRKRISTGKRTTFYLTLTPLGRNAEAREVSVQENIYSKYKQNDSVNVYLMKGLFDIPWMEVIE